MRLSVEPKLSKAEGGDDEEVGFNQSSSPSSSSSSSSLLLLISLEVDVASAVVLRCRDFLHVADEIIGWGAKASIPSHQTHKTQHDRKSIEKSCDLDMILFRFSFLNLYEGTVLILFLLEEVLVVAQGCFL